MNNLFKPILLSAIVLLDINNEVQCTTITESLFSDANNKNDTKEIYLELTRYADEINNMKKVCNTTQTLNVNANKKEKYNKIFEPQTMSLKEASELVSKEYGEKYKEISNQILSKYNEIIEFIKQYNTLNKNWKKAKNETFPFGIQQYYSTTCSIFMCTTKLYKLFQKNLLAVPLHYFVEIVQNKLCEYASKNSGEDYIKTCQEFISNLVNNTNDIFKQMSTYTGEKILEEITQKYDINSMHAKCIKYISSLKEQINMVNDNLIILEDMDQGIFLSLDVFLKSYSHDINELFTNFSQSQIIISRDQNSSTNHVNIESVLNQFAQNYAQINDKYTSEIIQQYHIDEYAKVYFNTLNDVFCQAAKKLIETIQNCNSK